MFIPAFNLLLGASRKGGCEGTTSASGVSFVLIDVTFAQTAWGWSRHRAPSMRAPVQEARLSLSPSRVQMAPSPRSWS